MSKEDIEKLLNAIQNQEKETKEKLQKNKTKEKKKITKTGDEESFISCSDQLYIFFSEN